MKSFMITYKGWLFGVRKSEFGLCLDATIVGHARFVFNSVVGHRIYRAFFSVKNWVKRKTRFKADNISPMDAAKFLAANPKTQKLTQVDKEVSELKPYVSPIIKAQDRFFDPDWFIQMDS